MDNATEKPETKINRRELLSMAIPRGVIPLRGHLVIEKSRCTGCTLCAQECSTGALRADGVDAVRLLFHQELCDLCGQCVEICPESCLTLKKGWSEKNEAILFADEIARCERCGVMIGAKSLIAKIKEQLQYRDKVIIDKLSLCSECKGIGAK